MYTYTYIYIYIYICITALPHRRNEDVRHAERPGELVDGALHPDLVGAPELVVVAREEPAHFDERPPDLSHL